MPAKMAGYSDGTIARVVPTLWVTPQTPGMVPGETPSRISGCHPQAIHRRMARRFPEPSRVTRSYGPTGGKVGRAGTSNSHAAQSPQAPGPHSPAQEILAQTVLVVHNRKIDHRRYAGGDRAFLHVPGLGRRHNAPAIGKVHTVPRRVVADDVCMPRAPEPAVRSGLVGGHPQHVFVTFEQGGQASDAEQLFQAIAQLHQLQAAA